jgi:hypothetical protein
VSTPEYFINGTQKPFRKGIMTATGQLTVSTIMGDVELYMRQLQGKPRSFVLKDVLFVPDIKINLVGTIRLGRKDIGVNLLPTEVIFTHIPTDDVFGYGDIVRDLYLLRLEHQTISDTATVTMKGSAKRAVEDHLHQRHDRFQDGIVREVMEARQYPCLQAPKTYQMGESLASVYAGRKKRATRSVLEAQKHGMAGNCSTY